MTSERSTSRPLGPTQQEARCPHRGRFRRGGYGASPAAPSGICLIPLDALLPGSPEAPSDVCRIGLRPSAPTIRNETNRRFIPCCPIPSTHRSFTDRPGGPGFNLCHFDHRPGQSCNRPHHFKTANDNWRGAGRTYFSSIWPTHEERNHEIQTTHDRTRHDRPDAPGRDRPRRG